MSKHNNTTALTTVLHGGGGGSTIDIVAAREDKELQQKAISERHDLPTTIEGFKAHPRFMLHRHISKYQALRPGAKPMGMHRGEAYYLREDVGEVHTADTWKRKGREVVGAEVVCPAKRLKKRGSGGVNGSGSGSRNKSKNNEEEEEEEQQQYVLGDFYGVWQTKEWNPPAAADGKVPKNARGNVEAPPFAHALPRGTVHIPGLPGIGAVCRTLGIDYAPALVGFDVRQGRSIPKIDGIVVCVEHEETVRAGYAADAEHKAEQAKKKRVAEAERGWREVLRALLMRVRLGNTYASGGLEEEAAVVLGMRGGGGGGGGGGVRGGERGRHRRKEMVFVQK